MTSGAGRGVRGLSTGNESMGVSGSGLSSWWCVQQHPHDREGVGGVSETVKESLEMRRLVAFQTLSIRSRSWAHDVSSTLNNLTKDLTARSVVWGVFGSEAL